MPKPAPEDGPSVLERISEFYESLDVWLQAVIVLGAAGGVLLTILRWLRPRIRETRSDLRAIRDTLVGRPAVRDSITRKVISPAIPSIGDRMASQEEALQTLVKDSRRIDAVEQAHTSLDKRVSRIEDVLSIDQRLGKLEAVQLLRTIETVAQADPGPAPEGERPD